MLTLWRRTRQTWRYVIAVSLSLAMSLAGVLWSVYKQNPSEAGRGGAIATVLAFWILFLLPDFGREIYEERLRRLDPRLSPIDRLDEKLESLRSWILINSNGQAGQNRALVLASAIGTLFWGFGDLLAKHLIK